MDSYVSFGSSRLWLGRALFVASIVFLEAPRYAPVPDAPAGGVASERPPVATHSLRFDANQGQFHEEVSFTARGGGYSPFFTKDGATLTLPGKRLPDGRTESATVRMRVVDGRPVQPTGFERLSGRTNYFVGDRTRWRSNIESFSRVRYQAVRPGVDLVFHGHHDERAFEYDFIVDPKADPSKLALMFEGAQVLDLDSRSGLTIHTGGGDIQQRPPIAYQVGSDGQRTSVAVGYRAQVNGGVGFAIGPYDHNRALIIDPIVNVTPTFVYSTYFGGTSRDSLAALATDASGAVYMTGSTQSTDFPTEFAFQPVNHGGFFSPTDAFVTKLDPNGAVVYSTFLGGSDVDSATSIAVDGGGAAYVGGSTLSLDFPLAAAVQPIPARGSPQPYNGFLTKLGPTGELVFSTYLSDLFGGGQVAGVGVDALGAAYALTFGGCPAMSVQHSYPSATLGFCVTKLTPSGNAFANSTSVGGGSPSALAVNGAGFVSVVGSTVATDLPTAGPFQGSLRGGRDAFVAGLNASGALVYSTYFGGSNVDQARGVATDVSGAAYVTGSTSSTDFPLHNASQVANLTIEQDGVLPSTAFVSKFTATGSLVYSTYLGGSVEDVANAIAADTAGAAYVVGFTGSPNFPVVNQVQTPLEPGPGPVAIDAFVTKLSAVGTLVYSTYFGGNGIDEGQAIAVDGIGQAYFGGFTESTDLRMVHAAQSINRGNDDMFVAKLPPGTAFVPPTSAPAATGIVVASVGLLLLGIAVFKLRRRVPRG
jgi:hypothetical protein